MLEIILQPYFSRVIEQRLHYEPRVYKINFECLPGRLTHIVFP